MLSYTESAKGFLLAEGTDAKYGARPLKRTIERNVVLPLSNIMATRQIGEGDVVLIDLANDGCSLMFKKHSAASIYMNRYESPFGRKQGFKQPRIA